MSYAECNHCGLPSCPYCTQPQKMEIGKIEFREVPVYASREYMMSDDLTATHTAVSLRDQMAMAALTTILNFTGFSTTEVCEKAYQYADAMLDARKKLNFREKE